TELGEQDTSSRSGNDAHADDADIKPIYDEEPMDEVQLAVENNVFDIGQQHTEQPGFNNVEEVDQNAKQWQQSQVLNEKSNEAKVKHDIDVIETINIELEHKVATLLKENETLKRHYKELSDSIKTTRAKTIEHTTSLIAKNDEFKAQLQNEVNLRAKVPSNKTTNRNKPIEQTSVANKQERQILKGQWFSIKKTSVMHEKTMTPRSCLRWKPTGKIFKIVGLRWIPTGKIFESSTTKVDSEPLHGSNTDITNLHECIQTIDSSVGTSINVQDEQNLALSAGTPSNLKKERIKACIKENVISGRPRLHGIALIQEISRQKSQGIQKDLTLKAGNPVKEILLNRIYMITETSANSDIQDLPLRYQVYQGRLLASFQDDAKYEHVGQDTISQYGKDDQDKQGKDLKISESKTKLKDNVKGSRSKITKHEGTSLQHNKDQRFKNSTAKQSQEAQGIKI
ncbi:hypothetical protein Tco_0581148, partial [Tanacetum coccineum]